MLHVVVCGMILDMVAVLLQITTGAQIITYTIMGGSLL